MWTRIMSYVAEFRCCREGEAEGGMWSVKRPIMMTYNNKPKDTLYSWGEDKLVYLGEIVDGWLDYHAIYLTFRSGRGRKLRESLCEGFPWSSAYGYCNF